MSFTAQDVKKLRDMTNAGFMDCKTALTDAEGDIDEAVKILREKGTIKASKKASRTATEGLIVSRVEADSSAGLLLEVGCNTDFVARNEDFVALVGELGDLATTNKLGDVEGLRAAEFRGKTVSEELVEQTAKIGENIQAARLVRFATDGTPGVVEAYIHPPGKIGTIIQLKVSDAALASNETVKTAARDICLHIAASAPPFLGKDDVPAETLEAEKAIYKQQAMNEGKPENIAEKIVMGRIKKYYEEACLLYQPFVKDGDLTIEQLLQKVSKEAGGEVSIAAFARLAVGENAPEGEDDE